MTIHRPLTESITLLLSVWLTSLKLGLLAKFLAFVARIVGDSGRILVSGFITWGTGVVVVNWCFVLGTKMLRLGGQGTGVLHFVLFAATSLIGVEAQLTISIDGLLCEIISTATS